MLKRKMIVGMIVAVLVSMSTTAWGTTYYVDPNGNDSNGLSWSTAFNYLQDALDEVSSGDEIWVAEGTYYPDEGDTPTNDDRTEKFQLVDGVGIYGGFDATETARSQRDWVNNVTTLSGDIDDDGVLNDDNSYHVVYSEDCDTDTVLDGFTLTAGNANSNVGGSHNRKGGGMYNDDSSPTVTNCIFTGNNALAGGGMYNGSHSDTAVTNCTFVANTASYDGGGMRNINNSNATVKNCLFFMNSVSDPSIGTMGGAMENTSSEPEVTNCTFVGNVAGGGWSGDGGALNSNFTYGTVVNCIFWGNWATSDGAEIWVGDYSITISYCDIEGGLNGSKVYDPGEDITDGGGNISTDPCFINIFDFSDITIAAGTTTTIEVEDANRYTVNDEIEYDNDGVARKVTDVNTTTDIITFANDALDANSVMGKVIFDWGFGATDVDEDFHLDWYSTCINVGDPNGDYDGQTDIDGEDRVSNTVEIGADEFQECLSSDANEYDDWLYWERPDCWCYERQCRGDTNGATAFGKWVELADLNKLKEAFGKTDAELEEIEDGICADLDHIPTFNKRVALSDLDILNYYFGESEPNVPPCDESPVITGPYNFWTN